MSQTRAKSSGRLDQVLALQADIKSRSTAKRLVDAGKVRVNGKVAKKASLSIHAGDTIEYDLFDEYSVPDDTGESSLQILYEDKNCFVVNKPAGIAVHPGSGMKKGERTVLDELKPLFRDRALPFTASSVLVHRLDKDTTGCLLIAKTPEVHQKLQKQFEERSVEKFYLAIVYGKPSPAAAVIDAPIGRHGSLRTKMSVHHSTKPRTAQTTYRTKASDGKISLLECELHTGRTHQIRVHLAAVGHPVLGDPTYATKESRRLAEHLGINSLCLHAWKLGFTSGAKKVKVEAPVSITFEKALETLKTQETKGT